MEREVKVGHRDALLVVSKRVPVRVAEIGGVLSRAFGEVYGHLAAGGVEAVDPPFVIYHGAPTPEDDPFDIEVCAPVRRAVDPPRGWQLGELPAGTFASLVHVGPYDTVSTAYVALTEWVGAHDMIVAGPPREVYLSPAETPPEQIRTVIEFPVAQLAASIAGR